MDLPVLNDLEKIYPSQDTGAEAIRKLVKNQNLIEQGIKEIDDINDLDEVREQISILQDSPNFTGSPTIQGQQIVTTEITTIDFPYNSEYENQASSWCSNVNKQGNKCQIKLGGKKIDGTTFDANTKYNIGTLPSGYCPKENFMVPLCGEVSGSISYFGWVKIYSTGSIAVYFSNSSAIRFYVLTPWYAVE